MALSNIRLHTSLQSLGLLILVACTTPVQTLPSTPQTMSPAKSSSVSPETKSPARDIYLLIGQSNMAGRAQFVDAKLPALQGTELLNGSDEWEAAENPLNRYSTVRKDLSWQRLGPGYSFARAMRKGAPTQQLALVVNARGGSAISEWAKDAKCYQDALRRIAIARTTGTLRGILWHQGETDFEAPNYLEKLKELVGRLRTDLALPELPFVAGEINNIPALNAQIRQLPSQLPFTAVASAEGLKATDEWHFDTESILLLGQRYAEQMQVLLTP